MYPSGSSRSGFHRWNVCSIVLSGRAGKSEHAVVVGCHFETKKVIWFHPPAITSKWVTKRGVSLEYLGFFDDTAACDLVEEIDSSQDGQSASASFGDRNNISNNSFLCSWPRFGVTFRARPSTWIFADRKCHELFCRDSYVLGNW